MGREGRDYWEAQLSEYWDSGLTIQEYSELKELPYESTRRCSRRTNFITSSTINRTGLSASPD